MLVAAVMNMRNSLVAISCQWILHPTMFSLFTKKVSHSNFILLKILRVWIIYFFHKVKYTSTSSFISRKSISCWFMIEYCANKIIGYYYNNHVIKQLVYAFVDKKRHNLDKCNFTSLRASNKMKIMVDFLPVSGIWGVITY